jgi:hypothetical protein
MVSERLRSDKAHRLEAENAPESVARKACRRPEILDLRVVPLLFAIRNRTDLKATCIVVLY